MIRWAFFSECEVRRQGTRNCRLGGAQSASYLWSGEFFRAHLLYVLSLYLRAPVKRVKSAKKGPNRSGSLWAVRCDSCEGHSLLLLTRAVIIHWYFLMTFRFYSSLFPNREEELSDYKNIGCKGNRKIDSLRYFHLKSVAQIASARHGSLTWTSRWRSFTVPVNAVLTESMLPDFFSPWIPNGKEKNKMWIVTYFDEPK